MGDLLAADLLRIAAGVRDEVANIDRLVAELAGAVVALDAEPQRTVVIYGCAALLEGFTRASRRPCATSPMPPLASPAAMRGTGICCVR
jgi:hypothetical protein